MKSQAPSCSPCQAGPSTAVPLVTGKQKAMPKVMDVTMNGGGQQRQSFGAQHKGLPVDSGQPGPDTQLLLAATAGDVAKP